MFKKGDIIKLKPEMGGWYHCGIEHDTLITVTDILFKDHFLFRKHFSIFVYINNKTPKMKTFVTSDHHFYHSNMITWKNMQRRYPFNSQPGIEKGTPEFSREILMVDTLRMNETLISNWNSVVGKNDLVYHLGDIAFASANKIREIVERLNGNIHLIIGNHEKWKVLKNIKDLFVGVDNYKEIKYSYDSKVYHICMMHYPIQQWNRMHYNSMMLCGHSHGTVEHDVRNGHIKYDVGVDTDFANFYPILLDNIILNTKKMVPTF